MTQKSYPETRNTNGKRSERLTKEEIAAIFSMITDSPKTRGVLKDEMKERELAGTKHQLFKLLDDWVDEGKILKVKTLMDGRTVRYYL
jgi:hypothetical protein